MAEIHTLVPREVKKNEATIEILRDWLKLAESGELQEVALAGVCTEDRAITAATETDSIARLVGVMDIIKHRLIRRYLDEA